MRFIFARERVFTPVANSHANLVGKRIGLYIEKSSNWFGRSTWLLSHCLGFQYGRRDIIRKQPVRRLLK